MDWSQLDTQIESIRTQFNVPACSVAIVEEDRIAYLRGFGTRTVGKQERVDGDTCFALASISKSTTAACLAILVDEGKLNWDDPVREYLADFELYDAFASREIRIRDLLVHNSGLPEISGGTIWYGSNFDRKTIVRRLRYLKPKHSFRSAYAYQNITFLVAGEIIAAVSGMDWDDFVQDRIFKPLDMQRTTTRLPDLLAMQNIATPHAYLNGRVTPIPYRRHDNIGPAASVNASARDWAQYVRLHLNLGVYQGRQILDPARVRELWSPQTVIPVEDYPESIQALQPDFQAYGMGWFLRSYRDQKIVYHAGGVDGMRTLMTLLPKHGFGVLVFSNLEAPYFTQAVTAPIIDQFLVYPAADWSSEYHRMHIEELEKDHTSLREKENQRTAGTKRAVPLKAFAGEYEDRMVGKILVESGKDCLHLSFTNNPAFTARLVHWHQDTFEIQWADVYFPRGFLQFVVDADGRPVGISLDQPNLLDVDFNELEIRRSGDVKPGIRE